MRARKTLAVPAFCAVAVLTAPVSAQVRGVPQATSTVPGVVILGNSAGQVPNASLLPDNAAARVGSLADATQGIRASIATGRAVRLPAGTYHLTDMLTTNGRCLIGDGRTESVLTIGSDFNPNAPAVIQSGTAEPGLCIRDIGISFNQPQQQMSRANFLTLAQGCTTGATGTGCKYPPAVLFNQVVGAALGSPLRPALDGVRISGAWDGIRGLNYPAGLWLGRVEVGALNIGLDLDNLDDFSHIAGYHFWPWGFFPPNAPRATYTQVYQDGQTIAARIGSGDITIQDFTAFDGQLQFPDKGTGGVNALISNLELDSPGANLVVSNSAATVHVTNLQATTNNAPSIQQSAGLLQVSNLVTTTTYPTYQVVVSGGRLELGNSDITLGSLASQGIHVTNGGNLIARGLVARSPIVGALTGPIILNDAVYGCTDIQGAKFLTGIAGTTGVAISVTQDNSCNVISGNDPGPYTVSLPGGTNPSGSYGNNPPYDPRGPWISSPLTITSSGGTLGGANGFIRYKKIGTTILSNISISITGNGTGSGQIAFTGLPFYTNAYARCTWIGRENAAAGKSLIGVGNPMSATTGYVTNMDGTYPGGTGYLLELSGSCEGAN